MFQGIGNLVGASIGDLDDLEPSGCGIDHGHGMKGDFIFLVPELVGTDQVDTKGVPGDELWFFGWKEPVLLLFGFEGLADVARTASLDHACAQADELKMLT